MGNCVNTAEKLGLTADKETEEEQQLEKLRESSRILNEENEKLQRQIQGLIGGDETSNPNHTIRE